MKMTREIVQKVNDGDTLTDSELAIACEFYDKLTDELSVLGEAFIHARLATLHTAQRLRDYQLNRRKDR